MSKKRKPQKAHAIADGLKQIFLGKRALEEEVKREIEALRYPSLEKLKRLLAERGKGTS